MNPSVRGVVITDSNVLINLMHVSRLDLLRNLPGCTFVVPDHVREEITVPDQRAILDAAINAGTVMLESITDLDALATFTGLIAHLGQGEAACIVIAARRGWFIASDGKRRFRREAEARLGRDRIFGT